MTYTVGSYLAWRLQQIGRGPMIRGLMMAVVSAAALALSAAAFAQQGHPTAQEARAMLDKVVAAVEADKTKALDMFNKEEGGFRDRDLYPFCFNISDGKIVAVGNPNTKGLIGMDRETLKGATKGLGWDVYTAANLKTDTPISADFRAWGSGKKQTEAGERLLTRLFSSRATITDWHWGT
jgi:hypothetical protein